MPEGAVKPLVRTCHRTAISAVCTGSVWLAQSPKDTVFFVLFCFLLAWGAGFGLFLSYSRNGAVCVLSLIHI